LPVDVNVGTAGAGVSWEHGQSRRLHTWGIWQPDSRWPQIWVRFIFVHYNRCLSCFSSVDWRMQLFRILFQSSFALGDIYDDLACLGISEPVWTITISTVL